jgi:hypothetical protein
MTQEKKSPNPFAAGAAPLSAAFCHMDSKNATGLLAICQTKRIDAQINRQNTSLSP